MALTDEKLPYEILIRFGQDGKPRGAHVQYRRLVVLDDEVLKDDEMPAEPLTIDNFPASSIMGDTATAALARINEVEEMLRQADDIVAEERSLRQQAEGEIRKRDHAREIAAKAYEELERKAEVNREKAAADIKALNARIAELVKAQAGSSS